MSGSNPRAADEQPATAGGSPADSTDQAGSASPAVQPHDFTQPLPGPELTASSGLSVLAAPPPPAPPAAPRRPNFILRAWDWLKRYFTDQDPTFWNALLPALVLVAVIYTRSPTTNCIFDEQEALLANPYVNGDHLLWRDAFTRDFWGLPPTGSIGSYRPIPNLIWRALWRIREHPWLPHWVNLMLHAVNATLVCKLAMRIAPGHRGFAWLSGLVFISSAVLTEAVTGVVGIADVLGGMGVLFGLLALGLPAYSMPVCVFLGLLFGLFSKESAIVAVPLIGWAALLLSPVFHPDKPRRVLRTLLALLSAIAALVVYTELRRRWFPVALPADLAQPLPDTEPALRRGMHAFMRWFAQPRLPKDPINNPLVDADLGHRVAGALRVYARGLGQTLFPWTLSGDYSFPQEPIPERRLSLGSVLGGLAMFAAPVTGVALWIASLVRQRRERRHWLAQDQQVPEPAPQAPPTPKTWSARHVGYVLLALALVWVPVAYFPHSNIPVLLPTVRAERFWYLPVIGLSPLYAWALLYISRWKLKMRLGGWAGTSLVALFLIFQLQSARMHALDYTNDLAFWRATAHSSPDSAKAHLNYSVMLGARGFMEERLVEGKRAMELAPEWPMAHIYYGDALCRLHRADEAWPHYKRGFELNSTDQNLISLALQCLWDEKGWQPHEQELLELADESPGSWLAFLARDLIYNGEKHGGVDPQYRPRGYNEGPKKKED